MVLHVSVVVVTCYSLIVIKARQYQREMSRITSHLDSGRTKDGGGGGGVDRDVCGVRGSEGGGVGGGSVEGDVGKCVVESVGGGAKGVMIGVTEGSMGGGAEVGMGGEVEGGPLLVRVVSLKRTQRSLKLHNKLVRVRSFVFF